MERKHQFGSMNMEQENDDNIMGLVCNYQFENGSSQFVFLDVKGATKPPFIDHSRSFFTENSVQALASCNGFILLSGYSGDKSCYYVFNSLTKNITIIPQPCIQGQVVKVGLASNGSSQFEVVLIEAKSPNPSEIILGFHVFSSNTSEWRVKNPSTNLTLQENESQKLDITPLYSNGAIYWEIGGKLLVYKVQEDSDCELFELPNSFKDWSWQSMSRRCFCESRNGQVYYCYTDFDGFHVWELLKESEYVELYASNDEKRLRWRLVHSVKYEVFVSNYEKLFRKMFEWEPYKITPIAYSEQAQIMYLQIPGAVVSYDFGTGKLGTICTYTYNDMNFNCCLFLTSTTSGLHYESGRDLINSEETEVNLPLSEVEKILIPLSQVLE